MQEQDFRHLLDVLEKERFDSLMENIGIKSHKLLLMSPLENLLYAATPPPFGSKFVIIVDSTKLTTYKIMEINRTVSGLLSKLKLSATYPFQVETEKSFINRYDKLSNGEARYALSKADTLSGLKAKIT